MTDAFDVSLRVKLDYQAGAAARSAVADLGAIENTAKRLSATSSVLAVARDMGELRKGADVARVGLAELAAAGARLNRAGAGSTAVSAELGRVEAGAAKAGQAVDALGDKLAAAIKAQRAVGGFKNGAELEAFLKGFDAQVKGLGAVSAGAREARREVGEVGEAAAAAARDLDRMGTAGQRAGRGRAGSDDDPVRRAGQVWRRRERSEKAEQDSADARQDAFYAEQRRRMRLMDRSAAVEARRQREDERRERAAARGAEAQARLQGRATPAEGENGAGAPVRHAGPGGLRGALIAGARPLHMERLLMSAMTPTGLMGLGAGLGLAGVAHQIQDATGRAIELEDALNDIRRSTGTMSAEGVKSLEGDILRTSRATGETTGSLARMGAEAAAAGRPAAELPRFMELGAKAAGAFGVKADEVGARLTRIGADFGLDQNGLQAAADTAALLQERTGARGAGTLDFMAQAGGAAKLAGFAPDRVAAYGATMGHLGMAPGEAASTFTGLLEKLESAPMQGGGFKTGLSRIAGPNGAPESPYALRNAMRTDPSSGMLRFLEDVKRLPEGKRQTVLTEMFGAEEGDRIARMADHLDDFKRNLATVQDQAAKSGAVERVFKVFDEATSKKIDRATEAIGAFATKMGQHFAPAVGAAADATARFFGGWLDRMDRLKEVSEIAEKLGHGIAPSAEQQAKIDADPTLKAEVQRQADAVGVAKANDSVASPDPEGGRRREMERMGAAPAAADDAGAARERDRLKLVEAIRADETYARAHGGVGADDARDLRAAYAAQYPDKPLPAFAGGGQARGPGGPTGDGILARVSDGEFIVNARSTAKHLGTIKAINDDRLPAYATGGAVGNVTPLAARSDDPAAQARLEGTISKAVKDGVVAGLREERDHAAVSVTTRAVEASGADGGGEIGREGGPGPANLRYGRATGGSGRPSLRFGRTASGGYRSAPGGGAGLGQHHYRRTPGAPAAHGRQGQAGTGLVPNDGAPPGDGSSVDWSSAILRKKEGFIGRAQWDVNHYRLGYGTDTITRPDGSVHEVQRGDSVSREDAERDLKRRIPQFQAGLRREVGAQSWDRLDPATQGALTSVGYNYGGFSKLRSLRSAVATGDKAQIAEAVRGLQGHNGGVNRQRRLEEAQIIESGHLPASWHARDPLARAVARGASSAKAIGTFEDRATRSTAAERQAVTTSLRRPLSPRFSDPGMRSAYEARPDAAGGATGRGGVGSPPAVVHQNFYGQHDPRETARQSTRERNREVRRAQARAHFSTGRPA